MDLITTQFKIESLIESLAKARGSIRKFAREKAEKIAQYEKDIAITILKLQNGLIDEFEGIIIEKVTATNVEKVARGLCWKSKYEADLAESNYKAAITAIECLKAELNGYQSINKYSDYITNE